MYNHMPEGLGEARGAHTTFFRFTVSKTKNTVLGARCKQDSNGSLPGTYWVIPDGTVSVQSLLSPTLRWFMTEAPSVQKNERKRGGTDPDKERRGNRLTRVAEPTLYGQTSQDEREARAFGQSSPNPFHR